MQRFLILITLFISALTLNAQKIENVVLTAHLKNGDVITGKSEIIQIDFNTSYGNLTFPIGDVNSIKFSLQGSDFDKANLLNLLDKIDNGKPNEKNKAFDEIIKMEEGTVPFIQSYLNNSIKSDNSSKEVSVSILYEVMLAKYKISRNFSLYDEIVFNGRDNIEGTYEIDNIVLDTDYGRIKINRVDIESIDVKILAEEGFSKDNSFKVFANRNVTGNKEEGWLNTGILVKKEDQISISADGTIKLASLSGDTYTPDGGINGSPGPTDNRINYGQLVYKISQNGRLLKAGDNLSTIAERTGIIFISIYESVYNAANSGYYNANVKVK